MNCESARRALLLSAEGGAGTPGIRVRRHLDGCSSCSAERERIAALLRAVAELPIPDPGERYWDAFLPSVRRRIDRAGSSAPPRLPSRLPRLLRPLPLASAAAALIAAGLLAFRMQAPAPALPPSEAAVEALIRETPSAGRLQALADLTAGDAVDQDELLADFDAAPAGPAPAALGLDEDAASTLRDATALTTPSDAGGWTEIDDMTETLTASEARELIRSMAPDGRSPDGRSSTKAGVQEVLG